MKRIITAITLSALLLSSACGLYASAAGTKENIKIGQIEETEEVPHFYLTDEEGNITEEAEYTYADFCCAQNPLSGAVSTIAFDNPDPDTNYYDLANGEYVYRSSRSRSVYEMDKWFHANNKGKMYISADVFDADGTLEFCSYRVDEDEVWHVRIYTLQLHENNTRSRWYKATVTGLDKTGTKYYTTTAVAESGSFSYGVLKASWSEIGDVFD